MADTNRRQIVQRRSDLKRRYGMTIEEYETLLATQGGRCAICGKKPTKRRLAIDHDHKTKTIRGLLCSGQSCNYLLGRLRDNVTWLVNAANYLTNPPAYHVIGMREIPERKKRVTRVRKG